MTKWQGNLVITLLIIVILLLMVLVQNVFTGVASLSLKADKTQAWIETSCADSREP